MNLTTITLDWLRERRACRKGVEWFEQRSDLHDAEWPTVCAALKADGRHDWSLWVRVMVAIYGTAADRKALRNDPSAWVREVVARYGYGENQ